ncbi:MAG: hypothetical protein ABIC19_03755 [Patescibacteria group bacterium]|nr:hypothetical protein [Patescibacteria group bacterium]
MEPKESNEKKTPENQSQNKSQGAPQSKDVEENKLFAALGYLGILFLIPLLAKKESPYAQFHAKQGMVLFIVGFVSSFIIWIPVIGWAIGICLLVLFIMGLINALTGKTKELPVIGGYAKKINI